MTLHLLGAAALILALTACSGRAEPQRETAAQQARSVRVAFVQARPMDIGVTASGILTPREEATVGSELGGYRVAQVFAEEGNIVGRGAVLARLDPALIEGEIARARAQVSEAEARLARAGQEARRVSGLDNMGVLSQEAIDQRRFAAREAQAQLSSARASLRDLTTRRERLVLRAPVGGTIIERTIAPGGISGTGGDPLFRIARDSLIELAAEVPEADLERIGRGAPVQVTLPGGTTVDGEVRLISPRVQNNNQLGIVRIRLPVRTDLRAGGTATARFSGVARNVLSVPEAAVQFSARGPSVTVVGRDNRARRLAVSTGQRSGGFVELAQGPPAGTRVLLGGGAFILEGDVVRPVLERAQPNGMQPGQQAQPAQLGQGPRPAGAPPGESGR